MFVGHGTLAFALVGLAAGAAGIDRERATALAVVAALFATVPDVDMVYALTGPLGGTPGGPVSLAESFWAASTVVHRSVTHSLVLAVPAGLAFAVAGRSHRGTGVATVVGLALVALVAVVSGPVAALVMTAFVVGGSLVGAGAARYGLRAPSVAAAALAGLLSHPFGDVLTGQPPELLYPLPVTLLSGRIALSADPTVHLLGAFGFELAAIWAGAYALANLRGTRLRSSLRPRAALGAAYATAVVVLPPPTLDGSYHFVFSVLAVGMVGVVPLRRRLPDGLTALTTGLAGVTVAGLAYTIAYLALGAAPLAGVAPLVGPMGQLF